VSKWNITMPVVKVKGQGQISPKPNTFYRAPQHTLLPSHINASSDE